MKFNEKLYALRKEKKLSQEQLADKLDVSRQAVSKWESGQTYPEMDKLIALTKLFQCTLDDLTNDEVHEIAKTEKKNNITNFLDGFVALINRTINVIKSMTTKELVSCFMTMFMVFVALLLIRIPLNYIKELGINVFIHLGSLTNFICGIWEFILEIAYWTLFIILIVYIFKVRYLDNYKESKIVNIKEETIEENNLDEKIEQSKKVVTEKKKEERIQRNRKDPLDSVFTTLSNILMFFIKVMIAFVVLPFPILFLGLFIVLVVLIWLMFKGLLFFGILAILLGSILFTYSIMELLFCFLINRKIHLKRLSYFFVSSIMVIGIGIGITLVDFANFKYVDNIPDWYQLQTKMQSVPMQDDLLIYYHYNTIYEVDNSLGNEILIQADYYDKMNSVEIIKSDNWVRIYYDTKDILIGSEVIDYFINDLKNKTIYQYDTSSSKIVL